MKTELFATIMQNRVRKNTETSRSKNAEYAPGDDKLHNFKEAARQLDVSMKEAWLGMYIKHWVSVLDMIHDRVPITPELIDAKIGDCIIYLHLLEAIMIEESQCLEQDERKEYVAIDWTSQVHDGMRVDWM